MLVHWKLINSLQFDVSKLAELVRRYISGRRFYERRHSAAEDEGLIGLLNLQTVIIKYNSAYKNSPDAQVCIAGS